MGPAPVDNYKYGDPSATGADTRCEEVRKRKYLPLVDLTIDVSSASRGTLRAEISKRELTLLLPVSKLTLSTGPK